MTKAWLQSGTYLEFNKSHTILCYSRHEFFSQLKPSHALPVRTLVFSKSCLVILSYSSEEIMLWRQDYTPLLMKQKNVRWFGIHLYPPHNSDKREIVKKNNHCRRQEEPAILISALLLRMCRMYVASIRLDFPYECMECTQNALWSCAFGTSITRVLTKAQRQSKRILTFSVGLLIKFFSATRLRLHAPVELHRKCWKCPLPFLVVVLLMLLGMLHLLLCTNQQPVRPLLL